MTFKVFISSTSKDLREYREAAIQATIVLRNMPIAMEFFAATEKSPYEECMKRVDEADVVVLIRGHRYGWVPSVAEGGDGKKSITELEYDRARLKGKEVLGFVVDPHCPWTSGKEQDGLLDTANESEAMEVWRRVKALEAFTIKLRSDATLATFDSASDLMGKVSTAVASWALKHEQDMRSARITKASARVESARKQEQNGHIVSAWILYTQAVEQSESDAAIIKERFEFALRSFPKNDKNQRDAATSFLEHVDENDFEALSALGMFESLTSRGHRSIGQIEESWKLALSAQKHLLHAAHIAGIPDAWGKLGGVLKRSGKWAREDGKLHEAAEYQRAMLEAYQRGFAESPDAYTMLNYLEQRALVRAQNADPKATVQLFGEGDEALKEGLRTAMFARTTQINQGRDKPWAAFDLARGRHYLAPNIPRFVGDLEIALEHARETAKGPNDRHSVETTIESLEALKNAGVELDGLDEGIQVLRRILANDSWPADLWGRFGKPEPYLATELAELRRTLHAARASRVSGRQEQNFVLKVEQFISQTELRWAAEDEEALEKELRELGRTFEPPAKKFVRILWKIFGGEAIALLSGGIVPINTEAVAELIAERVESRNPSP